MKLTRESIMACRTPKGAWNKPQLALLGVSWPPAGGWIDRICGTEIGDGDYQRVMELATLHHKADGEGEDGSKDEDRVTQVWRDD